MITLPFILKVEGSPKDKTKTSEVSSTLTMLPPDLELAFTFLELEARCRNLGAGWKYSYISKVLIPFALIQPEPEYTILIEAFRGSRQSTFTAQQAANIAKIGTLLKTKSDEEFASALLGTKAILESIETNDVKIRGLVDQKSTNRLLPFFSRRLDVGPASKITNLVSFVALESEIDNAGAIEIAKQFHGLMEQLDTALQKHYQLNQFYHETTDNHLSSLEEKISEIRTRLEKNLGARGERVEKQTKSFQSVQRDKTFNINREYAEKSKNATREFIPVLTQLQNQIITIHNDLQLKKSKLNERNFDPKSMLSEIKAMNERLKSLLVQVQTTFQKFEPKTQEILSHLAKIDSEKAKIEKQINLEYRGNLERQDAETQQLILDSENERQNLDVTYDRIDKAYQAIVERISAIRESIQEQKDYALGFTLDPSQFPVEQTTDLLYIPIYVAKVEKQSQAQYIIITSGLWNPLAMDPGQRLSAPQVILAHTTEPIRIRLERIINSSETLNQTLDKVGRRYNLAADTHSENYLESGYAQLVQMGVIHTDLGESLKKSWLKTLRYCSQCGASILTRKGYCNECGKPILFDIKTSTQE